MEAEERSSEAEHPASRQQASAIDRVRVLGMNRKGITEKRKPYGMGFLGTSRNSLKANHRAGVVPFIIPCLSNQQGKQVSFYAFFFLLAIFPECLR